MFFLGCENDAVRNPLYTILIHYSKPPNTLKQEWRRKLPIHLSPAPSSGGPSFYAHVFHPAFNFDADEAAEAVDRFERHLGGVGKGVQGLRTVFEKVRESGIGDAFFAFPLCLDFPSLWEDRFL